MLWVQVSSAIYERRPHGFSGGQECALSFYLFTGDGDRGGITKSLSVFTLVC